MAYDAVVVGSGCFGAWTALRLRESGRSVALVDAYGPGNPRSSSGAASRLIRMAYGSDEIYTRWAMRSLEAWKRLSAENGGQLFHNTGVLWTALPGHPHAAGTLKVFAQLGVKHESLTHSEVLLYCPGLHFDCDVTGIFEPDSGVILAASAVQAVTAEAARQGVELISMRVSGVEDVPPAADYVFACGPWLPQVFPEVVGRRIQVTRQAIFYFDAPASEMPAWIDFSDPRGGYTFPPVAGKGFKLGLDQHGPEFDPDTWPRHPSAEETMAARGFLGERFPALADAALIETEVCQYESTSTGDFLIDQHPEMTNVWLVGGGSGHGFKHGPAIGEYVTSLLDGCRGEARFSWGSKSTEFRRTVY